MSLSIKVWTFINKNAKWMWTFAIGIMKKMLFSQSITILDFFKSKRNQSNRRNLECNQSFGYGEIPSPRHGWTQHELGCTWLDKWPPSCQWVSKNIGHCSCSLHILHGTSQTRMIKPGSDISKILDESPTRYDIYLCEGISKIFPMKFCRTRWVEDQRQTSRRSSIINLALCSVSCEALAKNSKSYDTLVEHHQDLLIRMKFHFFSFITGILKPYLVIFQSDNPLLPFMFNDVSLILYCSVRLVYKEKESWRCYQSQKSDEQRIFHQSNQRTWRIPCWFRGCHKWCH